MQKTNWMICSLTLLATFIAVIILLAVNSLDNSRNNPDLTCTITWVAADGDTLQVWRGEFMVSKRGAHELLFDSKDIGKIKVRTIRVDDKDNSWIKDSAVGYITIH